MVGQPKKKLQEIEEFADRCYTCSLTAVCVPPKHYMDKKRRPDPRDEIATKYREVYRLALMLHIESERLENLLRAKAGLEPRRSRFDEAFERSQTAEPGELEQQMKRESEWLRGADASFLD